PDSVGLYLAELSITSNGGNAEVSMSGEGISPVSIDLEPLYEPIFIYPWGGEVGYYLSLYNNTTAPQTFDIWIDILKPDSSIYGPVILRTDLTFAPSYQMTRLIRQSIPATAPSGTYSMRGHVGDYQTQEIWSEDSFPFTKVDYNDGRSGKPVSGWSVSGWDDEIGMANDLHPSTFLLHPCSPNPFNPTTVASYELRAASYVKLSVYDISGREVAVLVDGWREAGAHEVTFDAMGLAAGMYFVRLEAGEYVGVEKMVLLK
ncbi:MAG TPA: T9SS type A sorting domain-containing protein, partial [bacterium]